MTRDATWIDTAPAPMAGREFEEIRVLAYRTFGLDLKHGKEDLVSVCLQRLVRSEGFRSYGEYYRHIRSDLTGESLMALIEALATNHTAFLREAVHYRFLRERIAANWRAARPSKSGALLAPREKRSGRWFCCCAKSCPQQGCE